MKDIPEEIKNFYNQLENINSFNKWELFKQLDSLSNIYTDKWKDLLKTERLVLNFNIQNGILSPSFKTVSNDGKEIAFPLIREFTKDLFPILKERAITTKNLLLKARYNYILYEIEKNRKYAEVVIESYKKILFLTIEDRSFKELVNSIQIILRLTEKIKYNVLETKELILNFLKDNEITSHYKYFIIKEITNSPLFKPNELINFPSLCLDFIQSNELDYFFNKMVLETAIKICKRIHINDSVFYDKLAENEDLLLEEHTDDSDFIKLQIYADKIKYYQKSKNPLKDEARKEYSRIKSLIDLDAFEMPMEEKLNRILNKEINTNVKKIMSWDIDRILNYFSNDTPLFPDIKKTIDITTKEFKNSFLRFVTPITFDINVNLKKLTEQEEFEKEIFNSYIINLGIYISPLFLKTLFNGVINGKITYNHVYYYLSANTWYGQNFPKMKLQISKGEKTHYNWLNLMAPAIHNFFLQINAYVLSGNNIHISNLVLCTDSLTLKFEGALRDFLRLTSSSTSIVRKDEIREMLLEDLLNTDDIKEKFTENDIALFKMIFTKKGMNIRNNIAHCFYHQEDYTLNKFCKVFFCILRLGKYKLSPIEANKEIKK